MISFLITVFNRLIFVVGRFLCTSIDLILVMLGYLVFMEIWGKIDMNTALSLFIAGYVESAIVVVTYVIYCCRVVYSYFGIKEISNGTIGQRLTNIYVCNKDGNKPTFIQIFIKNSFDVYVYPLNILLILFIDINFFSGYIFIINALLMIFTPKSVTIGDIIAKTCVVHDKKYYTNKWSNTFNWINTDNFKKVCVLIIVVSVVVKLTPPKIYVEDVPDVNDRETYVFTRNKPMSDQEAFELVVEYDLNNHSEPEDRYYFPSQYTVHDRGVVMSKEEKIESNYYTRLDECDRPNPVTLEYSDSYKMNIYYWRPKDERYQTYYPLKR